MYRLTLFRRFACLAVLFLFAAALPAGEKKLMHCFTFTPIASAPEADWQAFYKATDLLPSKIPGVTKVWYGKLMRDLAVDYPDAETGKKLRAAAQKAPDKPETEKIAGEMSRVVRKHGVCMEMNDAAALKTYAADPYHKEWDEAYSKVRVPHTTTFDIIGQ